MTPEPIFGPYWDGRGNAFGDPLRIRRKLLAGLDGKPDLWIGRTKSPDPAEKSLALDKIATAARTAFELVPFDKQTGRGATETDAIRAVQLFLDWQEAKKSKANSSPTSGQLTAVGESPETTTSMSPST